jgi:hypothetical protein
MLGDVVVDTNIFGHAQNPELGAYFTEATSFLETLVQARTVICLDASVEEESSRALAEYQRVIVPTGLAAPVLSRLLVEGRYKELSGVVSPHVRTIVNRLVRKSMDKLFLCLAYESIDSVLVSHDHEDFPDDVRERADQQLGVQVVEAVECTPLLA